MTDDQNMVIDHLFEVCEVPEDRRQEVRIKLEQFFELTRGGTFYKRARAPALIWYWLKNPIVLPPHLDGSKKKGIGR